MWPVVVLEGMPPEIATEDGGKGWENPFPPKGKEGYQKWQRLCGEMVRHCKATWGDDVYQWYFEVWNEPDGKGYFRGTQEEYFKIYDHAVAGAIAADPKIRIGGLGGAGYDWVRARRTLMKAFRGHWACSRRQRSPSPASGPSSCFTR
jgi:xylan 1,4-beta-xylosidase